MSAHQELARDVLRELIEIDTTGEHGSTTIAAEAMARRLLAAGIPQADVHVLAPHPRKGNLIARLRGSGERRPLLLLAHLDVVGVEGQAWTVEPFRLLERDGHLYGRGTSDDKAMAAIWVANLIRLREEGFTPTRDLLVVLTADEEGGEHNGAEWLLREHRTLVDAEFGLNEGGYGRIQGGRRISNQIQASEKIGVFFELEARGQAGHSSIPAADNAIFRLARGLERVAAHRFPIRVTEAVRGFFDRMSRIESGQTADDMRSILRDPPDHDALDRLTRVPYFNALLRTTWTATRLQAGQGDNVLPESARAVLDCRILPGESPAGVQRLLEELLAGERITVRAINQPRTSPPSPLTPEVLGAMERITAELWPAVPVVPVMSVGATDSLRFRSAGIPMYGVSGLFLDMADVRAHAPDERIGVQAFYEAQEFLYRLVRALTAGA